MNEYKKCNLFIIYITKNKHSTPIFYFIVGNIGNLSSRRKKSSKAQSVLHPYIHGLTRTIGSSLESTAPSRNASALSRSKDDSRIQYELPMEETIDK